MKEAMLVLVLSSLVACQWPGQVSPEEQKARQDARDREELRGIVNGQKTQIDDLSLQACDRSVKAVRARLKAPATAKFPGCILARHEYEIRADVERKTFWVFGHVDAQNSFGAMIRTKWGVKLTRNPEWNVEGVSFE